MKPDIKAIQQKPRCELIGTDGNIFAVMGKASRTLKRAGLADQAKELTAKVMQSGSYDEALQIVMEYVEAE